MTEETLSILISLFSIAICIGIWIMVIPAIKDVRRERERMEAHNEQIRRDLEEMRRHLNRERLYSGQTGRPPVTGKPL